MTLARVLSLLVVMIVTLACRVAAAEDKDCRSQTMLPNDVRIVAPDAAVPPEMAKFSGAWNGPWKDDKGGGVLCHTLVVEEVFANGFARVVYSHGTYEGWKVRNANFWRATGRIANGVLRIDLPSIARPKVTYRLSGDELSETFNGEASARLTRMTDVSQVGCRPNESAVSAPPPDVRDNVTAEDLLAPQYRGTGPVHNDYFMPIGPPRAPYHVFKGALTIPAGTLFTGNRGCAGLPVPTGSFSAAFFTHGEYLVPVVRTILRPPGTIILSPGRVWSEAGDGGMSRASFPFVIVTELGNEAHNGLATFLFDDSRVSALRVQVVQETAPWAKFDFWGQLPMTYHPGAIMNEDRLRASFVAELQNEMPIRPWSSLPANARAFEQFDGDAAPADISANGLIANGAIYLRGCNTRFGPYPYCRQMRHGVFSVTKSLGAAVALFRLAQKYGDQVLDLKIKDYVTVTAAHDGWDRVTFRDALDMATGIGDLSPQRDPNDALADENKPKMFRWGAARTAKEKLAIGFTYGKYAWGPGEVMRYNSAHTFVLAAAMDSFLKKREGPNANLWDMVSNEVLQPIGIFHAPMLHTLEPNGIRGIPLLAFGFFPTIDDVAKLATLFQNGGRHRGQPILHAKAVATALYRTPSLGLPTGGRNRFGEARYQLSFWSAPYRTDNGCFFQIPFMSGLGGNLVVLLPNGATAFRFADGYNYDVDSMIAAGDALKAFCSEPPAEMTARPRGPVPLTAAELRALVPGNTFVVGPANFYVEPSGRLFGVSPADLDVGTWEITDAGLYCRRWNVRDGARSRCFAVYRDGEKLEFQTQQQSGRFTVARRPGNPEGY